MTPFEQRLAAFEEYAQLSEPKLAPSVSKIIDKFYRQRVNLPGMGDAAIPDLDLDALNANGQWLNFDTPTVVGSPGDGEAAANTTNILKDLFSSATNLVTNQQQTAQKLAQLDAAAKVQQAAAAAAGGNHSTALIVGGAIAVVALVALMGSRR